jgi:hypothetical protein
MNICYFVLLNLKFDQAVRMIERFSGPNISFVIHVDSAVDDGYFTKLKVVSRIFRTFDQATASVGMTCG